MLLITIIGGGTTVIGDFQIYTWQKLYNNVNVKKEIEKYDKLGLFKNKTANGVLKFINKRLNEQNQKFINEIA